MNCDKPEIIELPVRLDSLAAKALANDLKARKGQTISLDGRNVEFAGALGVQTLVAAVRQWKSDGTDLVLDPLGPAFAAACRTLGIRPADIGATTDDEAQP